jgi:CubicO group peptidase (beta-lactamase class C family)
LAVRRGDGAPDFATGIANRSTGVEATSGTAVQIGSSTKVLTATTVMQLAEAGEADLDAPVRRYVVERVTGLPYHRAPTERICAPPGHAGDDARRDRAAAHLGSADDAGSWLDDGRPGRPGRRVAVRQPGQPCSGRVKIGLAGVKARRTRSCG